MKQQPSLKDKVAVVTGGGRGIGRAAALMLARAGASVVVTARSRDEIEVVAGEIKALGARAVAIPADISTWKAAERLCQETERAFGRADVVVANAGILHPVGFAWENDADAWTSNIQINLLGVFYTLRAFLPEMVRENSGKFIAVSSGAASHVIPSWSAYAAAKAGVEHLVRHTGAELAHRNSAVRVHALRPGIVATRMQGEVRAVPESVFPGVGRFKEFHEKGMLRSPDESASLILWLATPAADDLNGGTADIDDPEIRRRMTADLGIPMLKGRGE
ncbi:MAG: SDR family NAD(P)-dependent oxidoreductase [Acidobacteriota bacterium]|jgi:NAD(P)-dependent dehydrogenase (short-subunit alcohol dehydrogenase family)